MNTRYEGEVSFANDTGGYGWIATDDLDEEVFYHLDDAVDDETILEEGERVVFGVEEGEKGPRAVGLNRADSDDLAEAGDER